jgi:hypothetical protein
MTPDFPLSKTLDPADFGELEGELKVIDAYDAAKGQHPMRRWEYAMAHRAVTEWRAWRAPTRFDPPEEDLPLIGDVGGAGSRFPFTLRTCSSCVWIIDAAVTPPMDPPDERLQPAKFTVEEFAAYASHNQFDVLTAISVLEHVQEISPFLRACHMLLKPGGLLFLTMDYWDKADPDTAHFHWMRERIYNPDSLRQLKIRLREIGFRSFGRSDGDYHGDTVYDYSFCSLAMVRR